MLANVYDRVSSTYDEDWNGIYQQSRNINIQQILKHISAINVDNTAEKEVNSTVDLAVGTGNAFHDLSRHIHINQRIGIDISRGMLAVAKQKLGNDFVSICDDALNIESHIAPQSQDLVLCHFIFSYVDPNKILERANRILKPGGLLSIATSTQQALAEIHRDYFPYAGKLLKVDTSMERATTPKSHRVLGDMVNHYGFDIVEQCQARDATTFYCFDDVANWALGSGWAAQYFDKHYWLKRIGARAWFASARLLHKPFYPVTATNDISLMLVRKPCVRELSHPDLR